MPGADRAAERTLSSRVTVPKSASRLIALIVTGASYLANPRRGPPQPRLPRKAMSPRRAGGRCASTQWTPPQHATADHGQSIVRQEERASHALVSERRQVSGHRGNTHPAIQGRPTERSRLSSTPTRNRAAGLVFVSKSPLPAAPVHGKVRRPSLFGSAAIASPARDRDRHPGSYRIPSTFARIFRSATGADQHRRI